MSNVVYAVVDMLDPNSLSTRIPNKVFIEQRLNEYAAKGWRVVHFDPMCTVLERSVPAAPQMLMEEYITPHPKDNPGRGSKVETLPGSDFVPFPGIG